MIHRTKDDARVAVNERMAGGEGTVTITHLLEPDEMLGRGRMYSRVSVPAGASVGLHPHDGESEFYYILTGSGNYLHDDDVIPVVQGDVVSVDNHHRHGIVNTGDQTLEFMALIVFADDRQA